MSEDKIYAELREIRKLLQVIVSQTKPEGKEPERSIRSLGWTREQAALVHNSLASFEEDWNAPGMEAYDRL